MVLVQALMLLFKVETPNEGFRRLVFFRVLEV